MTNSKNIKISFNNQQSRFKISSMQSLVDFILAALYNAEIITRLPENAEIVFNLLNKADMAEINQHYLSHEGPTDVLTFNYLDEFTDENEFTAAEIFICPEITEENAREFKTNLNDELLLYIVHAILHLSGYEDHTEDKRVEMRQAEQLLLEKISSNSPVNVIELIEGEK
ncbi:MAG: rRNA maturation RNase YbeY [Lentisphaeria bacterium]|nr:rRNA maturation RNase YbeY [Lentisphaeria bacterium]NQZ69690.1 rRNA maturation RNase YbeY [Lentisphaeria bacterium]